MTVGWQALSATDPIFDVVRKRGPTVGKASSMMASPRLSEADPRSLITHIGPLQR